MVKKETKGFLPEFWRPEIQKFKIKVSSGLVLPVALRAYPIPWIAIPLLVAAGTPWLMDSTRSLPRLHISSSIISTLNIGFMAMQILFPKTYFANKVTFTQSA